MNFRRMSSKISRMQRAVLAACEKRSVMIALAESCTGGMIAAAITDIPGSCTRPCAG